MKRNVLKDNAVVTLNLKTEKRDGDQKGLVVPNITNKLSIEETALLYHRYGDVNGLKLSAVYAALSLISNSIAMLPIYVKQHKDGSETVIENHPVRQLFYDMLQSKYTIIKQLVNDILIFGNAYVYIKRKGGKPEKLIYLRPSDVVTLYKEQEDTVSYQCLNHVQVPKEVPMKDMLHFAKDTYDGINGRGFLWFASDVLKLAGYTQQAVMDFFGNGCNLTGVLKFNGRVNDVQKKAIREQWRQIHGSNGIGGGLGILEGDADYIPISQNAAESQMLESRKYNTEDIGRYFNLTPVDLGDLSHSSYSTIEDSNIALVSRAILPLTNLIEEEINRKLITDKSEYIDFDETELLRGDKASLADFYTKMVSNAILTSDECRKALGYNPMNTDYSSSLMIPYTDVAQNILGNASEKNDES